jgi:ribosomal protein L40E
MAMSGCRRNMAKNTEKIPEQKEMAKNSNSCSKCSSEDDVEADITKKDPIAEGLLRLCAIINGTWNDILASIQSISFLREAALYIDCTILAIWKRKKQAEANEITKLCSECGSKIASSAKACPKCGTDHDNNLLK